MYNSDYQLKYLQSTSENASYTFHLSKLQLWILLLFPSYNTALSQTTQSVAATIERHHESSSTNSTTTTDICNINGNIAVISINMTRYGPLGTISLFSLCASPTLLAGRMPEVSHSYNSIYALCIIRECLWSLNRARTVYTNLPIIFDPDGWRCLLLFATSWPSFHTNIQRVVNLCPVENWRAGKWLIRHNLQ